MWPFVTDGVAWSVCRSFGLSVCLPVMIVSPAKMAQPIEMLFELWTEVAQGSIIRWDAYYYSDCLRLCGTTVMCEELTQTHTELIPSFLLHTQIVSHFLLVTPLLSTTCT